MFPASSIFFCWVIPSRTPLFSLHRIIMNTVLYFTAKWCGPCKSMKPHWSMLQKMHRAYFELVDVDQDDTGRAAQYNVRTLPCLVVQNDEGVETVRVTGADPERWYDALAKNIPVQLVNGIPI